MPIGTMAVSALEATDGPVVVGLEVGGAAVRFAGVLVHPRAGDVVLAFAQGGLVKAPLPQRDQDGVLIRPWYPDRIAVDGDSDARRVPCRLGRPASVTSNSRPSTSSSTE